MSGSGYYRLKHIAPALAAGAFLALPQAGCRTASMQQPASPVVHVLDETVWVASRPIDWPGTEHSVLVYFGFDESMSICGRSLNHKARQKFRRDSEILFGHACGHLVVLMEPLPLHIDRAMARAIAAHEAFHIAVHSNSLLPRLDTAFFPGTPDGLELGNVNSLANDLITLLRSPAASEDDICTRLLSGYRSLKPLGRAYFSYKTYWEWPAEFYMREAALGASSFEEYLLQRDKLSPEAEPIYIAGALAMERMETRIARAVWQRRYMEGESILNLFGESVGCAPLHQPSLQVDSYRGVDIFDDTPR